MNPRERLFAVLNGDPVDHTPIWLLFPYHPTSYYADVRCLPVYQPIVADADRYSITLNRRNLPVRLFSQQVETWSEESVNNGIHVQRHFLSYKGRRLCEEIRRESGRTLVKKLLASKEDFEFYASLPINLDRHSIEAELDAQKPQYMREVTEFPRELGAMMLDLGEPINQLYHSSQLEEYAIWSLTHADLVIDLLERVQQQKRQIYHYCLERSLADVYFMVGSELASPPLVSRNTFQHWIVPYASELIDMIHSHGKKAIQHYHGQIRKILPDFLSMGADALHTIEAPPVGDCTFSQAFEIVGNQLALIGNIQYDDFGRFTPEEMVTAVREVLDECRGKRLILSPSAGPYEEDLSKTFVTNYRIFLQTAWEYI